MSLSDARGPLKGIRVVDLTQFICGPVATQILSDYGADVIKVEQPGGDLNRKIGPARYPGMTAMFVGMNRGKRSVVLDLETSQGRADFLRLVASADFVFENAAPGEMSARGLGFDALRAVRPDLVYVASTPFGVDGPYVPKGQRPQRLVEPHEIWRPLPR